MDLTKVSDLLGLGLDLKSGVRETDSSKDLSTVLSDVWVRLQDRSHSVPHGEASNPEEMHSDGEALQTAELRARIQRLEFLLATERAEVRLQSISLVRGQAELENLHAAHADLELENFELRKHAEVQEWKKRRALRAAHVAAQRMSCVRIQRIALVGWSRKVLNIKAHAALIARQILESDHRLVADRHERQAAITRERHRKGSVFLAWRSTAMSLSGRGWVALHLRRHVGRQAMRALFQAWSYHAKQSKRWAALVWRTLRSHLRTVLRGWRTYSHVSKRMNSAVRWMRRLICERSGRTWMAMFLQAWARAAHVSRRIAAIKERWLLSRLVGVMKEWVCISAKRKGIVALARRSFVRSCTSCLAALFWRWTWFARLSTGLADLQKLVRLSRLAAVLRPWTGYVKVSRRGAALQRRSRNSKRRAFDAWSKLMTIKTNKGVVAGLRKWLAGRREGFLVQHTLERWFLYAKTHAIHGHKVCAAWERAKWKLLRWCLHTWVRTSARYFASDSIRLVGFCMSARARLLSLAAMRRLFNVWAMCT